jgi:thioredoxin 1
MSHVRQVSASDFTDLAHNGSQALLVDFYADWCAPCRAMAPVVERIAREQCGRLSVVKLNVDRDRQIAVRHGVRSIPTLLFFVGGEELDRLVGFPDPKEVKRWAAALLELVAGGKEHSRRAEPA